MRVLSNGRERVRSVLPTGCLAVTGVVYLAGLGAYVTVRALIGWL